MPALDRRAGWGASTGDISLSCRVELSGQVPSQSPLCCWTCLGKAGGWMGERQFHGSCLAVTAASQSHVSAVGWLACQGEEGGWGWSQAHSFPPSLKGRGRRCPKPL